MSDLPTGTKDAFVASTLTKDARDLWESDLGQRLVADTPRKMHRKLASYFVHWCYLIQAKDALEDVDDKFIDEMEKQGPVEAVLLKTVMKLDKVCRDLEKQLNIEMGAAAASDMAEEDDGV